MGGRPAGGGGGLVVLHGMGAPVSDMIDDANDRAERDLQLAIRAARCSNGLDAPEPTGHCLNCGERVEPAHRWCDDECRDDWQARRRAIR